MSRRAATLLLLVPLAPLAIGCSSSYTPAASPRASLVMAGGTLAFVRDGKKYEGGLFGGNLEEVVRGSPQAQEYAHQYKSGMVTGFALTMIGLAAALGGLVLTSSDAVRVSQNGESLPPTGLLIAGGGLLVELVGLAIESNAAPHLYDAINAYNDSLLVPTPSSARTEP
jgi:hypothetical protein